MKHEQAIKMAMEYNEKHGLSKEEGAKIKPIYGKRTSKYKDGRLNEDKEDGMFTKMKWGTFIIIYPPRNKSKRINRDRIHKKAGRRKPGLPRI